VSRVFESDFALVSPAAGAGCQYAHAAWQTSPPPVPTDTPTLAEGQLAWSPVNSKPKLLELIAGTRRSLVLTTEELTDPDMICALQEVASSAARPFVRIILSGDTGSNAAAVKHLLGLGLWNLEIRIMPGQLTNTSLLQNRELGYLFSDAAMIARLLAIFEADFTTAGASLPAVACTSGSDCTTVTCPTGH
jgi:hypothetical protein